jgi:hypothetical protein
MGPVGDPRNNARRERPEYVIDGFVYGSRPERPSRAALSTSVRFEVAVAAGSGIAHAVLVGREEECDDPTCSLAPSFVVDGSRAEVARYLALEPQRLLSMSFHGLPDGVAEGLHVFFDRDFVTPHGDRVRQQLSDVVFASSYFDATRYQTSRCQVPCDQIIGAQESVSVVVDRKPTAYRFFASLCFASRGRR